MESIADMDLSLRFALFAILGLLAGAFVNYLIYSWAYFPRHISPWAPPHLQSPPRRFSDRLPVIGWLGLRRETALHGRGFWIRPLLIELGCALALPLMYWFYTQSGGLLPPKLRTAEAIAIFSTWSHSLFVVHALLFVLMLAATFIDFDEQTIPDIITLPGTLIALVFSVMPWRSFLPSLVVWGGAVGISETTFNIPWPFAPAWNGLRGLVLGLAIWSIWIFALTDRRLILRRGWSRAIGYLVHGIRRRRESKWLLLLGIVGAVLLFAVWSWGGPDAWRGLLTALIGLAVGGGTVWAVRIVASLAMGQEAMGFGDVTLMAMIGAFLGWHAAIAGFFLAPLAAIAIVLVQFAVTRQPVVPFGPYLCAGTVIAVLGWNVVWNETLSTYAGLGSIVVWILIAALVSMGAMLIIWRQIKRAIFT
jgi:leader peptidase (prepilin peptidase) / N-methyltransferase